MSRRRGRAAYCLTRGPIGGIGTPEHAPKIGVAGPSTGPPRDPRDEMTTLESSVQSLFETVAARATEAGVFGTVEIADGMLVCRAKDSAEEAFYRVETHGQDVWVSLVMADRWQSESIEAQLMHTGDKLDELLDEELADLGYEGEPLGFEHFRSEDMLFTFRSKTPVRVPEAGSDDAAKTVAICLLGYEMTFRQLGDMDTTSED